MDLSRGKLFWLKCPKGMYPFFYRIHSDGFLHAETPDEFKTPGEYVVLSLGPCKILKHSKTKFLRFLTGTGNFYMDLTHPRSKNVVKYYLTPIDL